MPLLGPQEIWEHIIDNLAPDRIAGPSEHYADLRACALTCQSWVPRAQRQLYKHVELERLESMKLFARTLQESPTLCGLVKRVEFWFKRADWEGQPVPVEDVLFPAPLIARLGALHGLRFACCTTSREHTAIQIEFMKKWTACTQLRTLWVDGFYFATLEDLTRIVWSFPLLEELNIFQTGWADRGREVEPAEFPGRCENLMTVEMQETEQVDDLLPLLGTVIQKLSVAWMWDASTPDTYGAVSALLELRTLTFFVNNLDHPWMASILAQVRSPHLQELVLDLSLLSREDDSKTLSLLVGQESFDDLLARDPHQSVTRFKIVTVENGQTGKAERRLRKAQELLPRFLQRGGAIEVDVVTNQTA